MSDKNSTESNHAMHNFLSASDNPLYPVNNQFTHNYTPHKSQLLTAHSGSNPLTAAAATLLLLITKVQNLATYPDAAQLHQQLSHEIKAFETSAQAHYGSETLLVARYLICATLDELLQHTAWGEQGVWIPYLLLTRFHQEPWGGERFFTIIERLKLDPIQHQDLLELCYFCLTSGYQGKFRQTNVKEPLDDIKESLYQTIRWQQGELSKTLLISYKEEEDAVLNPTIRPSALLQWTGLFAAGIFVIAAFFLGRYLLQQDTQMLYQQIQQTAAQNKI